MDLLKSITQGELASLLWLKQAHIVSNYKGFAHSRIMYLPSFLAWRAPYPETSGYIIENFLVFNKGIVNDGIQIALDSAYWLLDIQSDKSYYYSGLKKLKPSSFNTAQIIFGLKEAFNFTSDVRFKNAYINAKDWILSGIDDSGKWTNGLYKENYFASYYSRAIWPLLLVSDSQDKIILEKSLNHLWQKSNENYSFSDLGFERNKPFLTHTIAYALEGFLESSIILKNNSMTNRCLEILEFVAHLIQQEKGLDGIYDDQWKIISNMKCVTGQAQFVSLFVKAFSLTKDSIFEQTCILLMKELMSWQIISKNPDYHGAFPASIPIYSKYFPFQMVNWTNKFFLDACYQMRKII